MNEQTESTNAINPIDRIVVYTRGELDPETIERLEAHGVIPVEIYHIENIKALSADSKIAVYDATEDSQVKLSDCTVTPVTTSGD